jgi:hypothetical protein
MIIVITTDPITASGTLRLLDALAEAEVREHDPGRGHSGEDRAGPVGREAAEVGQVAGVHGGHEERDDDDRDDRRLPPHEHVVEAREDAHADRVDQAEDEQQRDRDGVAGAGEDRPPRTHEMIAAGPAIVEAVSAPNSQLEPMIDPTLANSRPMRPTSRRMP